MFCKSIACLVVAKERNYVWQPCELPSNRQMSDILTEHTVGKL